ncbi:FAD-binding oxidoreductase [Candidatus Saccharibacteria bacterium]|nr:FAD-binding oxidoreductase [Candidatus Saccharibacteria bacterium]
MSKVAAYLRGHLAGEVSTRTDVREAMSTDLGVLKIMPEMVIYPRTTNDIRKVCRFAWQLASKGHALSLTVRGAGTDTTGASIGSGIVLATTAHMNKLFEYDAKQKLIRLQPGATVATLNQALSLYGTSVQSLAGSHQFGTIGGAIACAVAGPLAGKYGTIERAVEQLEVVLASGDVIQTGRINKRELNKRKGIQGFEGDIYRGIDGVLEEYGEVLDQLRSNDAAGYNSIADVKQKDGSFDLTPLFVGSQGTLGIITEMIVRAEFRSLNYGVASLVFADSNVARDALDDLCKMSPAFVEYFDASLFDTAAAHGHSYEFYETANQSQKAEAVVIVGFDEFNDRQRNKRLKKVERMFIKTEGIAVVAADGSAAEDILSALDIVQYTAIPDHAQQSSPAILNGFHVPTERLEEFMLSIADLAKKEHVELPLAGHVYTNTYGVYPTLELQKVGDKQKIFKLLDELSKLVYAHGGTMIAEGGEGRLKARFVYNQIDEKLVEMYAAIRKVCDPYGYLNTGVKESGDIRQLASQLRDSYDAGQLARFGL